MAVSRKNGEAGPLDPQTSPPTHRNEGTAMDYYAGIDVSLELASVCIVDANGKIVKETKVDSAGCTFQRPSPFNGLDRPRGRSVVALAPCRINASRL
jgi:hypothetical protein